MYVAFVLLPEATQPDADAIAAAYGALFPERPPLVPAGDTASGERAGAADALSLACEDGIAHVMLVAHPVPGGEAERNAARSLAAVGQDPELPAHEAHLVVPFSPGDDLTLPDGLRAQARVTAAVALATGAGAIYVGAASASHPADWYIEVAREVEDPVMLWLGVSHVVTDDDRHSFLSFGMQQFGQPELLLTAPLADGSDAIEYFYDLLASCSSSGRALAEGETIGRAEGEQIRVRHEPNPVDEEQLVACVDL